MSRVLVKSRVWPLVGYEPHSAQRTVHRSSKRFRVLDAGRRAGKSQIGGHELTVASLRAQMLKPALDEAGLRHEYWIVGPEYTDSEKEFRVLWEDLKRLEIPLDKPGSYNNTESGDMVVSAWGGRYIVHAKSAKYPSTLVGEGLSGVILAEAAKLKPSVWSKYIRPTLADFKGWALFSSTPEGRNWFYEMWKRGMDPEFPDWESWKMPAWVNEFVYPGGREDPEILDLLADLGQEKFNQEIGAEFTEFVGRVFKDFDEEVHVTDLAYNPEWPLYLAVDYGWTNPFVCLLVQVDVFDNVYVIGEYRNRHRDINEIAADLVDWRGGLATKAKLLYPDPASPGDTAVLSKKLRVRPAGDTGGEIKHRLAQIRKGLRLYPRHGPEHERKPRLLFDRSCRGMPLDDGGIIREMEDYRYPDSKEERKTAEPELPMKKDDHGPEALGRFYRGHYGVPTARSGRRGARVSTAATS